MKLGPVADRLSRHIMKMMSGLRSPSSHTGLEAAASQLGIEAIELETRVLYSAAPIPLEVMEFQDDAQLDLSHEVPFDLDAPSDFSVPASDSIFESEEFLGASLATPDELDTLNLPTEIVFIDSSVADFELIVSELTRSTSAEVIVLRADQDGLQQISNSLAERSGVSSVHVISHGSAGQVHLGSTTLSNENISAYAREISSWAAALHSDADILFYGCNLAADPDGQELVEAISELTQSDVAASVDLTGHESLGGDWELEFEHGEVTTRVITSHGLQGDWVAALDAPPTDGSGAIWITTRGPANAGGESWAEQEIVQLGDPNLAIGSGPTNGTFDVSNFYSAEAITGIHLVQSATVTVGDTTLQYGDLLFSVGANGTFGGVSADRHDILLFRPDSLTDYGSGSYYMFLDEGVHDGGGARNVNGISVIEKDVAVGGKLLSEGTLVVSRQDPNGEDLFIVHVSTTSYGVTGTTSTFAAEKMLNADGVGTNLDFSARRITGVEVLEDSITIGGATLNAGTILLTINANATLDIDAGPGVVNVTGQDVIALDVTTTEFSGFTDATATVLLDGSDIGLTIDDERIYGLNVISPNPLAAQFSITVDTTDDVADGNTASFAHLMAYKGTDGKISLREAIEAANNNLNNGSNPDQIFFDFQDTDSGHVYYRDDGIANSLSNVVTTTLANAAITDFDPDYPFAQHSWFRIDLDDSLPGLSITDSVFIDGYSQAGATENTATIGQNATLKIELTNLALNSSAGGTDNNRGLTFDTGADGSTFRGLNINEFGGLGVLVDYGVDNVTIQGNFIGTDITGTRDIGNDDAGIQLRSSDNLVGGSSLADRNVISGNDSRGIAFFTTGTITDNVVENNYIGVDSTGLNGLGNDSYGIQLYDNDRVSVLDNVISNNQYDGIRFLGGSEVHNATIQGNFIGVGADGSALLANGGSGIRIAADVATGNDIGGTGVGEGNVISGNDYHGIALDGDAVSSTRVFGNFIGSDLTGTVNLGNGGDGIYTTRGVFSNFLGGVLPGQGNTIAFNNGNGVNLTENGTGQDDGNSIRGNRIFANVLLGIDIADDGHTDNDYTTPVADNDNGPNRVQNYPVLQSAHYDGTDLTITGSVSGRNNIIHIVDFYVSSNADPSGYGEAERYLDSISVTTDSSGNQNFVAVLSGVSISANEYLTATTTHADGSTSEFSLNHQVSNQAPTTTGIPDLIVLEGSSDRFLNLHSTFDDIEDADTDLLYTIQSNSNPTIFDSLSVTASDHMYLDFADGQNGISIITVRATDTSGSFVETTFQVTVTPSNELPTVLNPIDTYVENEDAPQSTLNLLTTFADNEDSVLAYSILSNDNTSLVTANLAGDDLTFDYASNQNGIANIVIRATDSDGGFVDHAIAVTVNPVNDLPTVTDKSYNAGVTGEASGNVLTDSADIDGDALTATLVSGPSNGTVVLQASGNFVYTPNPGFVGTDSFDFVAEDGAGNSIVATAAVDVAPVGVVVVNNGTEVTVNDDDFEGVLLPTPEDADVVDSANEQPKKIVRSRFDQVYSSNDSAFGSDIDDDTRTVASNFASTQYNFTSPAEFAPGHFNESIFNSTSALSFAPGMLSSLTAFGNEIEEATNSINYAFVNSIVSFSGFSLIGATWLLRGGALFASMMANVPAWRIIDPLVVLRYSSDEEEGDESLQDIVEGNAAKNEAAPDESETNSNLTA